MGIVPALLCHNGSEFIDEDLCRPLQITAISDPTHFPLPRFEEPSAEEENVKFHTEDDVRAFLEARASSLGYALDREAKDRALRKLQSVRLAVNGTFATAVPPEDVGEGGQASSCSSLGIGKSEKEGKTRVISSVEDIYAAATAALSEGLVHCRRFEVWRGM